MKTSPLKALRGELALVGVTIVWGSTFVLVKSALADVSAVLFLALRFSLAALALATIYRTDIRRNGIAPGLLAGALLFVSYVFQTKGLELTTPSKSAFLTGLSIPMVPLIGSLVYRNRPRPIELAGILIATVGMALMTLPAGGFEMSRGDFLSFLCAVGFALHIVVVSHYTPVIGYRTVAVIQVATAAVLGFVSFPLTEPVRFRLSPGVAAAVLVTGLLATALAFTTMAWVQQFTSATRAALIFTLEPVVAGVTSYLLLGERLPMRGKVGAMTILAGVILVEMRNAGSRSVDAARSEPDASSAGTGVVTKVVGNTSIQ